MANDRSNKGYKRTELLCKELINQREDRLGYAIMSCWKRHREGYKNVNLVALKFAANDTITPLEGPEVKVDFDLIDIPSYIETNFPTLEEENTFWGISTFDERRGRRIFQIHDSFDQADIISDDTGSLLATIQTFQDLEEHISGNPVSLLQATREKLLHSNPSTSENQKFNEAQALELAKQLFAQALEEADKLTSQEQSRATVLYSMFWAGRYFERYNSHDAREKAVIDDKRGRGRKKAQKVGKKGYSIRIMSELATKHYKETGRFQLARAFLNSLGWTLHQDPEINEEMVENNYEEDFKYTTFTGRYDKIRKELRKKLGLSKKT